MTNFFATVAGNVEGVVQYNLDNRAFEVNNLELRPNFNLNFFFILLGAVDTNVTIEGICNILTDETISDPLTKYAALNNLILNTYSQPCLDASYNSSLVELKEISWNSSAAVGGRQWFWQTCTEFGFFQSTDSKMQPFGATFPIE